MGLDVAVPRSGPCPIAEVLARLAADGLEAGVIMVDGALHMPGTPVPDGWRDVRLKLAAGTVSLKRRPDAVSVVVFGNADAALTAAQQAVVRALAPINEAPLGRRPIRQLGLQIAGSSLEPLVEQVMKELVAAGIRRLHPRFYLSTEWGVPSDTIALAIPFYLASSELTALHAQRTSHVEGVSRADILRYLRHELGHVVSYAYRIYEDAEFTELFGAMTQPYLEEYRPAPFSPRFVTHLPGWYAQKHPDEDWAETFAVWMTPGRDWRAEHAHQPEALAKLAYVDRVVRAAGDRDPLVTETELDEDVGEIEYALDDFYDEESGEELDGLDGALRSVFDEPDAQPRPASELVRRAEVDVVTSVYRFTGHFPEPTRALLHHLARRADDLGLHYSAENERLTTVALTALVTALAMNHVHRGSYLP